MRHSFPAVSDTILRRGLGAVRLPAGIPTRRVRRGRAARDELFGVCDAIVAGRREGRTTGETDLLSLLLAARDGDERLGDDEVRSQVLLFMLAGHETTAIALTFALHLLGRHQDVQDGVRAEVREVLGDQHPTASTVAALPLTTAVLKEAMRLYPSAPIMGRLTVQEDELMGHRVPAGSNVVVVPWTIHRHPDFWVDPLVFDPSRFTGTGSPPRARAPLRVDAVRRRPARLHRPALLDGRGGAGPGADPARAPGHLGGRLRPAAGGLAHHALPDRAGAGSGGTDRLSR